MNKSNLFLIFSVFVFLFLGCKQLEVTEQEKQLFVRASEFSSYGFDFKNDENNEKIKKVRLFDGSYQFDYEFETPESELKNPLSLIQTISIESKTSDATISKGAEETGIAIGLKIGGIEQEEVVDFYKYGDSSSFYSLKKNGNNVGDYFVMRKGKKTFSIMIVGLYIDDAEIWKELIEPKLLALDKYTIN